MHKSLNTWHLCSFLSNGIGYHKWHQGHVAKMPSLSINSEMEIWLPAWWDASLSWWPPAITGMLCLVWSSLYFLRCNLLQIKKYLPAYLSQKLNLSNTTSMQNVFCFQLCCFTRTAMHSTGLSPSERFNLLSSSNSDNCLIPIGHFFWHTVLVCLYQCDEIGQILPILI